MAINSERRNRKQRATSVPFLAVAAVLAVIGFAIVLIADGGLSSGIGVAFLSFAGIAATVGIVLAGASFVEKRSREDKPFA